MRLLVSFQEQFRIGCLSQIAAQMTEEVVVEFNQWAVAPEILRKGFPSGLNGEGVPAAIDQPEELLCLAAPPAVDSLFSIPYQDQGTLFSLAASEAEHLFSLLAERNPDLPVGDEGDGQNHPFSTNLINCIFNPLQQFICLKHFSSQTI